MKTGKKPAFNPYLPGYEYIPDGEPYVFGDRVYIFGSHDESKGTNFCLNDYVCWSAPADDLGNWRYEGVIYKKTQDPMNPDGSHVMFAPDVAVGPDGRYYLYYGLDFAGTISVAVCDTPAGQYEYYGTVHYSHPDSSEKPLTEHIPYDPAVLVDDDGRVFLYYGFCPHFPIPWVDSSQIKGGIVTELQPDMVTIKEPPKVVLPCFADADGTGFEGHAFFEASSIRKIGDKYYLVYSSQQVHELCYAISQYPDRGYVYGGVIISNGDIGYHGRTPKEGLCYTGNNHGGLVEIEGQWYIFYHRHTQATQFSRQGCAESVVIAEDGSIAQVEITSCGLNGGPLPANGTYSAHIACNLIGPNGACNLVRKDGLKSTEPYIYEEETGERPEDRNQFIANITNGTIIGFKYFEFSSECNEITVQLRGHADGTVKIKIGDSDGAIVGESGILLDTNRWTDLSIPIKQLDDVNSIYVEYSGEGSIAVNSLTF